MAKSPTKSARINTQLLKLTHLSETQKRITNVWSEKHTDIIYETDQYYYVTNIVSLMRIDKSMYQLEYIDTKYIEEDIFSDLVEGVLMCANYGSVRVNPTLLPDLLKAHDLFGSYPIITVSSFEDNQYLVLTDNGLVSILAGCV